MTSSIKLIVKYMYSKITLIAIHKKHNTVTKHLNDCSITVVSVIISVNILPSIYPKATVKETTD